MEDVQELHFPFRVPACRRLSQWTRLILDTMKCSQWELTRWVLVLLVSCSVLLVCFVSLLTVSLTFSVWTAAASNNFTHSLQLQFPVTVLSSHWADQVFSYSHVLRKTEFFPPQTSDLVKPKQPLLNQIDRWMNWWMDTLLIPRRNEAFETLWHATAFLIDPSMFYTCLRLCSGTCEVKWGPDFCHFSSLLLCLSVQHGQAPFFSFVTLKVVPIRLNYFQFWVFLMFLFSFLNLNALSLFIFCLNVWFFPF